ncbi:peptidoglycan recognition family protein [Bacillus infantis]|uniref:peptidoglycan recognition protein family protein n=1 Tax=Bacillus infantis TaxID=324767 RepID=UPI002FBE8E34
MGYHFEKLPNLVDLRGKTKSKGRYGTTSISKKTEGAVHHSLTKGGSSAAFANFHVDENGWPGVAYHFVILKNGVIEWNHNLNVISYHVGNSNSFTVGICLVGDFRTEEPTEAQKLSLYLLMEALKKDLPNYQRTRGHNEYPGYSWKACPEFDYRAVLSGAGLNTKTNFVYHDPTRLYWDDMVFNKGQKGRITILKAINLWQRDSKGKLKMARTLNPGECYKVYGYDSKYGGQYDVGANHWITKMDGYIKYETPSKALLQQAEEFYK